MIKLYLIFFFYLTNFNLKTTCKFQIRNPDGFHGTTRGRGGEITSLLCHQGLCKTLENPPPPLKKKILLFLVALWFCWIVWIWIFEFNPVDLDLLWLGCSGEGGTPERGRWSGCQDPEGREGNSGPWEYPETDEQSERNVQEKLQQSHRV